MWRLDEKSRRKDDEMGVCKYLGTVYIRRSWGVWDFDFWERRQKSGA